MKVKTLNRVEKNAPAVGPEVERFGDADPEVETQRAQVERKEERAQPVYAHLRGTAVVHCYVYIIYITAGHH